MKKGNDHLYEADRISLMQVNDEEFKFNIDPKELVPSIKSFIKDLITMRIHPKLKKYLIRIIQMFY